MASLGRVLFVVLFALGALACGDDTDTATPVTGDPDEGADPGADAADAPELRTAVESYSRAVISGDPDAAVELHSEACADVEVVEPPGAGEGDASSAALAFYESEVDGETATVSYRYEDPEPFNVEDERWVKEDGEWKWDNC